MYIKKTFSLFLLIIFVLSAFVGCNDVSDDASSSITAATSSDVYNVNDNKTESTDDSTVDNTSSTEENESDVDSSNTSSQITSSDNTVSVGDSDDDIIPPVIEPTPDPSSSGESTTSSDNSIPTYFASLNLKGTTKTKEIDPGKCHFYKIKGAANQVLTIESKNVYVKYNSVTYSPQNGVLSFLVESELLARDYVLFEIGNKGSQKEAFKIQFKGSVGSKENPESINIVGEKITTTTKEGNDQGYSYSYVATKAGKLRFYILSDTKKGKLETTKFVSKNIPAVGTTDLIEETNYLITDKDSIGTYIEYKEVAVGDVITITIGPNSGGTSFPSVTVEWKIEYL